MRTFNVGAVIHDHLKALIEDYVDNNQKRCSCTNLNRLMLFLYELEITYVPIDDNGDVLRTAAPLILDRHVDLCPLFKICAMNRAIADLIDRLMNRSVFNQHLYMISVLMYPTSKCPPTG